MIVPRVEAGAFSIANVVDDCSVAANHASSIALAASNIDIALGAGVSRRRDWFDPTDLTNLLTSPYARMSGWEGTDQTVLRGHELQSLPVGLLGLFWILEQATTVAGIEDWEANYAMLKTSTLGKPLHPDRTDLRHVSFFFVYGWSNRLLVRD
jgi:hypothetical protein